MSEQISTDEQEMVVDSFNRMIYEINNAEGLYETISELQVLYIAKIYCRCRIKGCINLKQIEHWEKVKLMVWQKIDEITRN